MSDDAPPSGEFLRTLAPESLVRTKGSIKRRLRAFDVAFEKENGRMPTKTEKEPMRAWYRAYRDVKALIDASGKGGDGSDEGEPTTPKPQSAETAPARASLSSAEASAARGMEKRSMSIGSKSSLPVAVDRQSGVRRRQTVSTGSPTGTPERTRRSRTSTAERAATPTTATPAADSSAASVDQPRARVRTASASGEAADSPSKSRLRRSATEAAPPSSSEKVSARAAGDGQADGSGSTGKVRVRSSRLVSSATVAEDRGLAPPVGDARRTIVVSPRTTPSGASRTRTTSESLEGESAERKLPRQATEPVGDASMRSSASARGRSTSASGATGSPHDSAPSSPRMARSQSTKMEGAAAASPSTRRRLPKQDANVDAGTPASAEGGAGGEGAAQSQQSAENEGTPATPVRKLVRQGSGIPRPVPASPSTAAAEEKPATGAASAGMKKQGSKTDMSAAAASSGGMRRQGSKPDLPLGAGSAGMKRQGSKADVPGAASSPATGAVPKRQGSKTDLSASTQASPSGGVKRQGSKAELSASVNASPSPSSGSVKRQGSKSDLGGSAAGTSPSGASSVRRQGSKSDLSASTTGTSPSDTMKRQGSKSELPASARSTSKDAVAASDARMKRQGSKADLPAGASPTAAKSSSSRPPAGPAESRGGAEGGDGVRKRTTSGSEAGSSISMRRQGSKADMGAKGAVSSDVSPKPPASESAVRTRNSSVRSSSSRTSDASESKSVGKTGAKPPKPQGDAEKGAPKGASTGGLKAPGAVTTRASSATSLAVPKREEVQSGYASENDTDVIRRGSVRSAMQQLGLAGAAASTAPAPASGPRRQSDANESSARRLSAASDSPRRPSAEGRPEPVALAARLQEDAAADDGEEERRGRSAERIDAGMQVPGGSARAAAKMWEQMAATDEVVPAPRGTSPAPPRRSFSPAPPRATSPSPAAAPPTQRATSPSSTSAPSQRGVSPGPAPRGVSPGPAPRATSPGTVGREGADIAELNLASSRRVSAVASVFEKQSDSAVAAAPRGRSPSPAPRAAIPATAPAQPAQQPTPPTAASARPVSPSPVTIVTQAEAAPVTAEPPSAPAHDKVREAPKVDDSAPVHSTAESVPTAAQADVTGDAKRVESAIDVEEVIQIPAESPAVAADAPAPHTPATAPVAGAVASSKRVEFLRGSSSGAAAQQQGDSDSFTDDTEDTQEEDRSPPQPHHGRAHAHGPAHGSAPAAGDKAPHAVFARSRSSKKLSIPSHLASPQPAAGTLDDGERTGPSPRVGAALPRNGSASEEASPDVSPVGAAAQLRKQPSRGLLLDKKPPMMKKGSSKDLGKTRHPSEDESRKAAKRHESVSEEYDQLTSDTAPLKALTSSRASIKRPQRHKSTSNPVRQLQSRKDEYDGDHDRKKGAQQNAAVAGLKPDKLRMLADLGQALGAEAKNALASTESFQVKLRKVSMGSDDGSIAGAALGVGSVASPATPLLYQVRGRKRVQTRLVDRSVDSLRSGGVFILDLGQTLYQFNTPSANAIEKVKAADMCVRIKNQERGGRAQIFDVTTGGKDASVFWQSLGVADGRAVVPDAAQADPTADEAFERECIDQYTFYGVSNGELQPLTDQNGRMPGMALLDPATSVVVDTGAEVYLWVGKKAPESARKGAMDAARRHFDSVKRPPWAVLRRVAAGTEPVLFKEKFTDFPDAQLIQAKVYVGGPVAASKKDLRPCDPADLVAAKPHVPPNDAPDDDGTTGTLEVYRVCEVDKEAIVPSEYGHLFSEESYVMRYTYRPKNRDVSLYYFWQGVDSSINEKGAAALFTVDMDKDGGRQIRVPQGKETPHFASLFKGLFFVHKGRVRRAAGVGPDGSPTPYRRRSAAPSPATFRRQSGNNADLSASANGLASGSGAALTPPPSAGLASGSGASLAPPGADGLTVLRRASMNESLWVHTRMYAVHGRAHVRAAVIECHHPARAALSPLHSFVVASPFASTVFAWRGRLAHADNWAHAVKAAASLAAAIEGSGTAKQEIVHVEDGREPPAFWDALDSEARRDAVATGPVTAFMAPEWRAPEDHVTRALKMHAAAFRDPRLFEFSSATGEFVFSEVHVPQQHDLSAWGVFLVDTWDSVYVWVGPTSKDVPDRKLAFETAASYAAHVSSTESRPAHVAAYAVYAGGEPTEFTQHFQCWDFEHSLNLRRNAARPEGQGESGTDVPSQVEGEVVLGLVPLEKLLETYRRTSFTMAELQARPLPPGVDATKLETYLDDAEFVTVLGVDRASFEAMPVWKRTDIKKKAGLF